MVAKRFQLLRVGAVLSALTVASTAVLGPSAPANAQTAAALSIVIAPEIPAGATISTLPTNVGQRIFVQITNSGSVALTNQQFVVRLAQKPDLISAVNDGVGNVGLIDPMTGAWYHTIAQLPPGVTATYSISTLKYCPGRWPIAARVGDKVAVTYASWVGPADARCVADETANPVPSAYYALAWPATAGQPIVPPASSTTALGTPTTTTIALPGATLPGGASVTTTTIAGTKPTLINLTLTATTTTTTIATPSGTSTSGRTKTVSGPTTTILFCKTVGGKRYCAPKYSVYKPGQKKVLEKKATAANKRKAAAARAARATR